MERSLSKEPAYIPRAVAVLAIAATALVGVRVYQDLDYSDVTGCPATGKDPVAWIASPVANLIDSQGYQSDAILARDNCPR